MNPPNHNARKLRREFVQALAGAMAVMPGLLSSVQAQTSSGAASSDTTVSKPEATGHDMRSAPASWRGNEQIAMMIYPQFTALDMVGPQYMLASMMGAKVHIVAKTLDPVRSDTELVFLPSKTFDDCPENLDILFVPGGTVGTLQAIKDERTLAFVADRGSRAKLVTSVCTGSLVLGAAGLLKGYQATSHWITRDLLKYVGAKPVDQRVVCDRNRITGAGVSAGLDFGLSIVELLRDTSYAQGVQLLAEYAPQPHLNAGTTQTAPAAVHDMLNTMFAGFVAQTSTVLKQSKAATS